MNHLLALITTDNNVCGHWSNLGRKQTTAMVLDRRLMLCCRPLLFWSTRLCGLGFFSFPNERGNRAALFPLLPTHTDIHRLAWYFRERKTQVPAVSFFLFSLSLSYCFSIFSNIFLKFLKTKFCVWDFFFRFLPGYIFRNRVALWPGRLVSCGQLNRDSLYEERERRFFFRIKSPTTTFFTSV